MKRVIFLFGLLLIILVVVITVRQLKNPVSSTQGLLPKSQRTEFIKAVFPDGKTEVASSVGGSENSPYGTTVSKRGGEVYWEFQSQDGPSGVYTSNLNGVLLRCEIGNGKYLSENREFQGCVEDFHKRVNSWIGQDFFR